MSASPDPIGGSPTAPAGPPAADLPAGANQPRRPWLALLLGVVCAPAAYLYVGLFPWCLAVYALTLLSMAILGWTGWVQSVGGVWLLNAIGISAWLFNICFPWTVAREHTAYYRPRWYNRWYYYPLFALPVLLVVGYSAQFRSAWFGYDTFRVPSASMAPTIAVGDFIVTDARPQIMARLARFDLVVVRRSAGSEPTVIRRIIGLPGETIEVDALGVRINGELLRGDGGRTTALQSPATIRYPLVVLGDDQFYLMGDNRENSLDSRTEGASPGVSIRGKVSAIWYAREFSRIGPLH